MNSSGWLGPQNERNANLYLNCSFVAHGATNDAPWPRDYGERMPSQGHWPTHPAPTHGGQTRPTATKQGHKCTTYRKLPAGTRRTTPRGTRKPRRSR
eukprot:11235912-Alexandrium_andersonii.AAC.1